MSFSYRRALKSPTAGLLGKSNRDNGRERGPWDKRLAEGVAGTRISYKPCRKAAAVHRVSFKSSALCTRDMEAPSAGTFHALRRARSSFSPTLQETLPESCEHTEREQGTLRGSRKQ